MPRDRAGEELDGSENYDFQLAAFEAEFCPRMTEEQVAAMELIADYSASEIQCVRYLRHFFLNQEVEAGFRNLVLDRIVRDHQHLRNLES